VADCAKVRSRGHASATRSAKGQGLGPLYDVTREFASSSPTPLFDAARTLLAEGVDPATPVAMRHAGADHDALRTTVRTAARLTVADSNQGKPVFKPYRPYNGPSGRSVEPPTQEDDRSRDPSGDTDSRSLRLYRRRQGSGLRPGFVSLRNNQPLLLFAPMPASFPARNHFHPAHRIVLRTNANHMACTSARTTPVSSARARRPLSDGYLEGRQHARAQSQRQAL
jgi:hypothetical protein